MNKYILTVLASLGISASAFAQQVEMADKLRSEGKIYIVVAVMLVIFLGVAIYLFTIDKRVKNIENHQK